MEENNATDLMGSEILKAVCLEFSGVPYPNKEIMVRGARASAATKALPVLLIPSAIAGLIVGLIFGGSTFVMLVVTIGLFFYFGAYPSLSLTLDQRKWRQQAIENLGVKARELKLDDSKTVDFYKKFTKKLRKNPMELASIVLDDEGMALLKKWQAQQYQEAVEMRQALVQGFRDAGSALGNELKKSIRDGWNGR